MSRAIDTSLLAALTTSNVQPFFAVELLFDTDPLRIWTGFTDRTINVQGTDQVFTGSGSLLNIDGLDEVKDLSAKSVTLSISGITSDALAYALTEPYQRRTCRIYLGEMTDDAVVEIFTGKMDTMKLEDTGETSNISLTVESNLVELERASNWRYTNENHQSRYDGDTFFSYVQSIQDQSVAWGRTAS